MSEAISGESERRFLSPDSIGLEIVSAYEMSLAREINGPLVVGEQEVPSTAQGRFERITQFLRRLRTEEGTVDAADQDMDETGSVLDAHKLAFEHRMKLLTPLQRLYFAKELSGYAKVRPFLANGVDGELLEEQIVQGIQELDMNGSSDASLYVLNALQLHLHIYEKMNRNPEFMKQIDERRENFRQGVIRGVQGKWLDSSALSRLESQREVPIYLGDLASTEANYCNGYYNRNQDFVVISPFGFPQSKGLKSIEHELGHARLEDNSDPSEEYYFQYGWYISESLVEHNAMVMNQQADPESFKLHIGSYGEVRTLMETMLALGRLRGVTIDVTDLSRAISMRQIDRTGWLQTHDAQLTRAIPEITDCGSLFIGIGTQIQILVNDKTFHPELQHKSTRRLKAAEVIDKKMRQLIENEYRTRFSRA